MFAATKQQSVFDIKILRYSSSLNISLPPFTFQNENESAH